MKDLLIVGGGPAAASAGIYAARRGLSISLITKSFGGHVSETDKIENYPGFSSVSGMELAKNFENHLKNYKVEIFEDTEVKKLFQKNSKVIAELENGKKIESKAAIVASGSERKMLNIPGEEKFRNNGVTYCAICDGPVFQDEEIAVIGGSNSGVKAALYLSKIAKKVYLIEFLDRLNGEKVSINELEKKKNVEIITSAETKEFFGDKELEGLKYKDLKSNKEKKINVKGAAIEIGLNPNSDFINVKKDKNGRIKVDDKMKTSSERIFAAGDVNNKGWDQIVVAASQGCIAALESEEIINKN
ncbi:MAG: NAD(P)/FAD-dependent oxidoreductase [Minisyncoccales bacterium]